MFKTQLGFPQISLPHSDHEGETDRESRPEHLDAEQPKSERQFYEIEEKLSEMKNDLFDQDDETFDLDNQDDVDRILKKTLQTQGYRALPLPTETIIVNVTLSEEDTPSLDQEAIHIEQFGTKDTVEVNHQFNFVRLHTEVVDLEDSPMLTFTEEMDAQPFDTSSQDPQFIPHLKNQSKDQSKVYPKVHPDPQSMIAGRVYKTRLPSIETTPPKPIDFPDQSQEEEEKEEVSNKTAVIPKKLTPDLSLKEILGVGGSGYVQLGIQHVLKRDVAVKRISGNWRHSKKAEELISEARLAGSLEHPNIIPIHLLAQHQDGEPLIIMKRVEGVSWSKLLTKGEALWPTHKGEKLVRHLKLFLQVCRAIEYAHSRGVLHLDIKPDNVMIGDYGEVYLVDWGIGTRIEEIENASVNRISGTPGFMTSEMVRGRRYVSEKSDIGLLGATLHILLMGEMRHTGVDVIETLKMALESNSHIYPAEMHSELSSIINQACTKNPKRRFSSARTLRESVEAYLEHRTSLQLLNEGRSLLKQLEQLDQSSEESLSWTNFREKALTCRLTLEHSLQAWAENKDAEQCLQDLLTIWCRFEIKTENLSAAESLFNVLIVTNQDLRVELKAAQIKAESLAIEHARLLEFEKSFTFEAGTYIQSIGSIFNGMFWCLTLLIIAYLNRTGEIVFDQDFNLKVSSVAGIITLIQIFVLRTFFTDTKWRAHFTYAFISYLLILYLNRPLSLMLKIPIEHSLLTDAMFLTIFLALIAALVHPIFWFSTCLCLVSLFSIATYPEYALEQIACLILVSNIMLAYALRPKKIHPSSG